MLTLIKLNSKYWLYTVLMANMVQCFVICVLLVKILRQSPLHRIGGRVIPASPNPWNPTIGRISKVANSLSLPLLRVKTDFRKKFHSSCSKLWFMDGERGHSLFWENKKRQFLNFWIIPLVLHAAPIWLIWCEVDVIEKTKCPVGRMVCRK